MHTMYVGWKVGLHYSKAAARHQRAQIREGMGIVGVLCFPALFLSVWPWTNLTSVQCSFFPVKSRGWIGLSVGSGRQPENLLRGLWKSLIMENLFGRVARGLSGVAFGCFETSERERERENRKLCLLCKQLIALSISTSLPYNGDKNLIIQRHANVAILVFTHSHLITMPLTLCNLLCELRHIKNVTLITASHGITEDSTRIIGVWKGTCWGLHSCEAKTESLT